MVALSSFLIFNPKFDKLPNGDWVMWFNAGGLFNGDERDFIILKRKK